MAFYTAFQSPDVSFLNQLCNIYDNIHQEEVPNYVYVNNIQSYSINYLTSNSMNYQNLPNAGEEIQYDNAQCHQPYQQMNYLDLPNACEEIHFDNASFNQHYQQTNYHEDMSNGEENSSESESSESSADLQELVQFALTFKQRRIRLGFTQAKVGELLAQCNNGVNFSQTTICRFENLQLTYKNAMKLMPLLQHWLDRAAENVSRQRISNIKLRKHRTSMSSLQKESLERHFMRQDKPPSLELSRLADIMNLEKEVVRVWFCNRRARQKRIKNSI